jgi:multidrug transporter EmrE-like cation transporter
MLVAGLFHASWHAIVKTGSSLSVLAGMGLVSAVLTLPFLFIVPFPSNDVWPILLLSLVLHAAYKVSLALAYDKSELSRAYPLARGLVPLFATGLSYRLFPIDLKLTQWFGVLGKPLSMLLFFHLVCLGWIFFRATPAEFLPIVKSIADLPFAIVRAFTDQAEVLNTMAINQVEAMNTIHAHQLPGPLRQFLTLNPVFAAYAWGLVLFAIPLVCVDYLGWRSGCEFPDLFERMPWPVRTILIAALFYGILFLARREANEFIYFAF